MLAPLCKGTTPASGCNVADLQRRSHATPPTNNANLRYVASFGLLQSMLQYTYNTCETFCGATDTYYSACETFCGARQAGENMALRWGAGLRWLRRCTHRDDHSEHCVRCGGTQAGVGPTLAELGLERMPAQSRCTAITCLDANPALRRSVRKRRSADSSSVHALRVGDPLLLLWPLIHQRLHLCRQGVHPPFLEAVLQYR